MASRVHAFQFCLLLLALIPLAHSQACSSGYYAECILCSPGGYAASPDSTTCDSCSVGSYSSAEGATECLQCDTGHFAPNDGLSTCDECNLGYYSSGPGATSCDPCDPGTTATTMGQTMCDDCLPGYHSSYPGATACIPCDDGFYAPFNHYANCIPCLAGFYATPEHASTGCEICEAGTYSTYDGASECLNCEPGWLNDSPGYTECWTCTAGTYCSSFGCSFCKDCDAGWYNTMNAAVGCDPCNGGSYQPNPATTSCFGCSAGSYTPYDYNGYTECVQCTPGNYQPNPDATECFPCDPNWASFSNGATSCYYCDIGHASPQGSSSCLQCEPGFYSDGNSRSACEQCEPGYVSSSYSSSTCDTCYAGSGNDYYYTACEQCSPGYYSSEDGSPCLECPAGSFSSSYGSTTCDMCYAGHAASSGSTGCDTCIAGTYASVDRASSCDYCAEGWYNTGDSLTSCDPCPAGQSSWAWDPVACYTCDPGTFSSADGQPCYSCAAGWYSSANGETTCQACPAGYTTDGGEAGLTERRNEGDQPPTYGWEGGSYCVTCGAGFYNSAPGNYCIGCDYGYWTDLDNATVCSACSAGSYIDGFASTECYECTPGSFASSSGSTTCDGCAPGSYSTVPAAQTCVSCLKGSSSVEGSTECATCNAGTYSSANGAPQCSNCPAGSFSSSPSATSCASCPAAILPGFWACPNCTAGLFFNMQNNPPTCDLCNPGSYGPTRDAITCLTCPAGSYQSLSQQTLCFTCPSGQYSLEGSISCTGCSAGYFSSASKSSTCTACQPGTVQPDNFAATCTTCSPGTYSSFAAAKQCLNCVKGSFSSAPSSSTCNLCDPGFYQSLEGQPTCIRCPPGSYASAAGASTCRNCDAGFVATGGASTCAACDAGTYQPSPASGQCYECLPGQASSAGATTCTTCKPGTYSSTVASSTCTRCSQGFYASSGSSLSCSACKAGYSQPVTAGTTCIICDAGSYSSAAASPTCTKCSLGSFSTSAGSFGCTACPDGTFQNSDGLTFCSDCPAGYARDTLPADTCAPCPTGTYAPFSATPSCITCPAGFYNNITSALGCSACPVDTYYPIPGAVNCHRCPAGKYQPATGQTTCICANGQNPCSGCDGWVESIIMKIALDSTGSRLYVTLMADAAVSVGSVDCGSLFTPTSLSVLGTDSICYWESTTSLRVTLGSSATVTAGVSISLLPDALVVEDLSSAYPCKVALPANPAAPTAVLALPDSVGQCQTLELDASLSTGGGGRDLTYSWSVLSGADYEEDINAFLATQTGPVVTFPSTVPLAYNYKYTFKLTTTNYFGKSSSTLAGVQIFADPVVTVTILGPSSWQTVSNVPLVLYANVTLPGCGVELPTVTLYWEQLLGPIINSLGTTISTNTTTLTIPANYLLPRKNYMFQVTAVANFATLQLRTRSQATASVTVLDSAPVAIISGGDRSVTPSLAVVLNGNYSYDPDVRDTISTYWWSCTYSISNTSNATKSACYSSGGAVLSFANDAFLSIPANTLVGGYYTFQLIVTSVGLNSTAASTTLDVLVSKSGKAPQITIDYPRIAPTAQSVLLSGTLLEGDTDGLTWSWVSQSGNINMLLDQYFYTPRSQPNLVLRENVLLAGYSYSFILKATNNYGAGYATAYFKVRNPPSGGNIVVFPTVGEELTTGFRVQCNNWVTDDPAPLSYYFTAIYTEGGSEVLIASSSTSARQELPLAVGDVANGYKVTIVGYIETSEGVSTRVTTDVTVTPLGSSNGRRRQNPVDYEAGLYEVINGQLTRKQYVGDVSGSLSIIQSLGQSINTNRNSGLYRDGTASSGGLDAITFQLLETAGNITSGGSFDEAGASFIAHVMDTLTNSVSSVPPATTTQTALNSLNQIVNSVVNSATSSDSTSSRRYWIRRDGAANRGGSSSSTVSTPFVQSTLNTFSGLMGKGKGSTRRGPLDNAGSAIPGYNAQLVDTFQAMMDSVDALGNTIVNNHVCGQDPTEVVSTGVTLRVQKGAPSSTITSNSTESATVFSSNGFSSLGDCVQTVYSSYSTNLMVKDVNSETQMPLSGVGSLTVATSDGQAVTSWTGTPVRMQIPLDNTLVGLTNGADLGDAGCYYLDSNGYWSNDGVTVISITSEYIICESDHLTDFGLLLTGGAEGSDEWTDDEKIIVITVSVGVATIVATLACFVIRKHIDMVNAGH